MPRARDPNRDKAYEIWKESKGKKKLKDIAAELGVSDSQIRKWKSQDKWEQKNGNVTNSKRSVTKHTTKESPRVRSGNPNPKNQFSHRNNPKLKHGLLSKYLHEEQIEIMELVSDMDFIDQLWYQIQIKFSAIIRMQKVMWVQNADDHLREESGNSSGEGGNSETFKVAFAYEQYESYIKAQTRAMAEYRNMIKQYLELADKDDEKRLKLDIMQQQLSKLERENSSDNKTEDKLKEYFTALGSAFRGNEPG